MSIKKEDYNFPIGNATVREIMEKMTQDVIKNNFSNMIPDKSKFDYILDKCTSEIIKKSEGIGHRDLWCISIDEIAKSCLFYNYFLKFKSIINNVKDQETLNKKIEDIDKELKDNLNDDERAKKFYILYDNAHVVEELSHSFDYNHKKDNFDTEDRRNFFLDFADLTPKVNTIYL